MNNYHLLVGFPLNRLSLFSLGVLAMVCGLVPPSCCTAFALSLEPATEKDATEIEVVIEVRRN